MEVRIAVSSLLVWHIFTGVLSHMESKLAADALRAKYSIDHIVHDKEHIKKDIQAVTDLVQDGEITPQEAMFYFIRMHDFDNNSRLDGLELMVAFQHEDTYAALSDLENSIDLSLTAYDVNKDGFLDFAELSTTIQ